MWRGFTGAMRNVLAKAIETLERRVGDAIDVEIRDFLAVHGKPGQPCPRCGAAISEVTLDRRSTHFCRTCQPGLMTGGAAGARGEGLTQTVDLDRIT